MSHTYDPNREYAHWAWLRLQLPNEGVASVFPDETACLTRLTAVRWPDGVVCDRCGQDEPRKLTTRNVYECRACKRQFSCKSGTIFHRSRIPLTIWFQSAEFFIQNSPQGFNRLPQVAQFENLFDLHHPAATRLRRILSDDLSIGREQFLGRLVFAKPIQHPDGVELYSPAFADWLRQLVRDEELSNYI